MGMLEDVGIDRKNFALSDRSIFRVLDAFGQIRPTSEHVQVSAMSRAQTEVAFAAQFSRDASEVPICLVSEAKTPALRNLCAPSGEGALRRLDHIPFYCNGCYQVIYDSASW